MVRNILSCLKWPVVILVIALYPGCYTGVHLSEELPDNKAEMLKNLAAVENCYLTNESKLKTCNATESTVEIVSKTEVALHVTGALSLCDIDDLFILRECVVRVEPNRSYFR